MRNAAVLTLLLSWGALSPSLTAAVPGPPTVVSIDPPPGNVSRMSEITIVFSEPVTGVEPTDLRINDYPGNLVFGSGSNRTFHILPPAYGVVQLHIANLQDLDSPANTLATNRWQYTVVDTTPPSVTNAHPTAGSTVRALGEIEVFLNEPVNGLEAADLRVNGTPATNLIVRPEGRCIFQFAPVTSGSAAVNWAASHGITDYAATPNGFTPNSWSYTVNPALAYGDVVINEFVAGSRYGLQDEDGLACDWIELRNRGATPVDLEGWSLSDDPADLNKWIFPSTTLNPGGHLLLFASGKDRKSPEGADRMHLNFVLSAGGEFFGLFGPDSPRTMVSGFAPQYPPQRNDYSYGLDAQGHWRYFASPTPGAPNAASAITNLAQPVHFSVERGLFTQPFDLTLSTATPGATIRYTTNGTQPTLTNGTLYLDPLRITGTTFLRAAAFRPDLAPSIVHTHTYFFNLAANLRSLPVMSIVTEADNLTGPNGIVGIGGGNYVGGVWYPNGPDDYNNNNEHGIAWERPVSAEYLEPADNSGFQIDCGIRVSASDYSRLRAKVTDKFSYRLYFRSDYGPGKLRYPLFPTSTREEFDVITLRGGHNDASNPFIKDELCRRLFSQMGNAASQGTFVNLFINGVHKGYFNPVERADDDAFADWEGGGEDWDSIGVNSSVRLGDDAAWRELLNYSLNGAHMNTPSVYQAVGQRMDLVNFVDYLILEVYGANWDWPHNNWFAARARSSGGLYRFYAWDLEAAFDTGSRPPTYDVFAQTARGLASGAEISRFFMSLTNSAEFRLLFADRIQMHFFNDGSLTESNITARFNEMRSVMAGMIPSMNLTVISTWVPNRRAPLFGQFRSRGLYASNAPAFNQPGGRVPAGFDLTMTSPLGGTIYYTTDGTDPRVTFTGAVAPGASRYTNGVPVRLAASAVIRARALNGGTWSPVTEAEFQVAELGSPICITEINYNPPGGNAYEFVELHNAGALTVDLSGWVFDNGISFLFPNNSTLAPGGHLILANNASPTAFMERYPAVAVFGWFGGNLNNAGERLTLKDASGRIVLTVDYRSSGGWPALANGFGPSLEIADPLDDPDDPASWHDSATDHGTPGVLTPPPAAPIIRLNEITADNRLSVSNGVTYPDWIEIHNAGTFAAHLGGWSLTDDGDPRKFVFPADTVLPPGEYLVVWCDALTNTTPGLHTGFALDRGGDQVFLYDTTTNRVDAISFGQQLADYSVGRIGEEWVLTIPSPGSTNIAANTDAVSAVAINEWLANPPSGESDWFELFNRGSLPVALRGCFLATSNGLQRIRSLSFVAPSDFALFFADEGIGPDHLDLKLPAIGGTIALYDPLGMEVNRVTYPVQAESVSRGRLPDGTANFVNFVGSASPGAPNYLMTWNGPVLNEVLARNVRTVTNAGRTPDFVELFNPAATNYPLAGLSLSIDSPQPGQWIFPPTAVLPPGGCLVVWCDDSRPASTDAGDFNTGRALDGESGGAYLFNPAGQLVSAAEFGPQIADRSIGLSQGQWRLLAAPTPGATNAPTQALATETGLRFNEWMAGPATGADWFELYNTNALPVDLNGLWLTDDPSTAGTTQFRIPPLSFIGPLGWVKFVADNDPEQGRHHVNFNLDAAGETLRLYRTNGTAVILIDSVAFGAQQLAVSEGRLPDGATNLVRLPGAASPGEANYQRLPGIIISEILSAAIPPEANAIELWNISGAPLDVGGWYLSNGQEDFKKWRIPTGTVVPASGFAVFFESQFSNAAPKEFRLDAARGGEVWLAETDGNGDLTGRRTGARFGAAATGVSFGVPTGPGAEQDYVAERAVTLGSGNAGPMEGPVVLNELMYHPPGGADIANSFEFVELRNVTGHPVLLYDAARPTNTWRLRGGIDFDFPAGAAIPADGYALVVEFNPADVDLLTAFRTRFGVPSGVEVFGPLGGRLGNDGDEVELRMPGSPVDGLVPFVRVDRVAYTNAAPWPSAADGSGATLQRRLGAPIGRDPVSWLACAPTPGAANCSGAGALPVITLAPQNTVAAEGAPAVLSVGVSGPPPLACQWRFNGVNLPDETNAALWFDYVVLANDGFYDVQVANPAGALVSDLVRLRVASPPSLLVPPADQYVRVGETAQFNVVVRGTEPIIYQWRFEGTNLPGETNSALFRSNVQLADEGVYELVISNPDGTAAASAALFVLINPVFIQHPLSQLVAPGERVTLSAAIAGNPPPFEWEWRLGSVPVWTNFSDQRSSFFTLTAPGLPSSVSYRAVVRNAARTYPGVGSSLAVITIVADTDDDGLPDDWETTHGLSPLNPADRDLDSDSDGLSNYEEYVAGTNPTGAASWLKVECEGEPGLGVVHFSAASNKTYTVEFTDDLRTGAWNRLADVVARNTNRVEVIPDPAWRTTRFYRLVTPARP